MVVKKKQTSTLTEEYYSMLCHVEGRPSEEKSLSPLVSLIKAYLEEKNIMKMGVWFVSVSYGSRIYLLEGHLGRSSSSPFSLFLESGNTFTSLSLLSSLLFLRILDSGMVGDMFMLILDKTSQGEWEDLSGKTTAHVGMVSGNSLELSKPHFLKFSFSSSRE